MSTRSAQRPAGAPPAGPLTAGSLCSGYGGLDLAVMAVTGARLAWCAETDRYAAGVLARHWPGVPNLGDVTALDWARVPPVDLVSAGWPCQDISYAGPGAGITEGTRSGLWLHIAAGLRHLRPSYVFLENVAALRTRGLAKVLGDLAALGYDTQWVCLRAADAGAPHRRDRLLVLAVRPGTPHGSRLLPTPVAGNFSDGASLPTWQARRDRQKKLGRNGNGIGTPLPIAIALLPTPIASDSAPEHVAGGTRPSGAKRQTGLPDVIIRRLAGQGCPAGTGESGEGRLLPTPDTGCSPNGHGRRGGRPGNGHQSGAGPGHRGHGPDPRAAQPARARSRGESTSRRSAAGSTSWGTPRRRPPSRGRPAGPGCRPRSPSG